jgi:nucleotide-binding universal stress UspA family protein
MERIVLAANPQAEQPWVADAVAQLARQTGASVSVLAVDELETEMLSTMPRSAMREIADAAATAAQARLRESGIESTKAVRSGRALDSILDYAEEQRADLIVVGSSVRSAVAERLLGSVPLALIRRSQRPVLVVTKPETGGDGAG